MHLDEVDEWITMKQVRISIPDRSNRSQKPMSSNKLEAESNDLSNKKQQHCGKTT